jgi:hypothetical protein
MMWEKYENHRKWSRMARTQELMNETEDKEIRGQELEKFWR